MRIPKLINNLENIHNLLIGYSRAQSEIASLISQLKNEGISLEESDVQFLLKQKLQLKENQRREQLMKNLTKFKFPGIDKIEQSYGQSHQDLFVLSMLNGKTDGIFLELGGAHPVRHNNTYLLESSFNWSGISMDNNMYGGVPGGKDWRPSDWEKQRPNTKLIIDDALNIDYSELLKDYDKQLDYLQLDIDCNVAQLEIMKKIIKTGHRFSVITFETDFYSLSYENNTEYIDNKKEVREVFEAAGYKLLVENVGVMNGMTDESSYGQLVPFEDWWVDVSAVDKDIYSLFENTGNVVVEPGSIFKK